MHRLISTLSLIFFLMNPANAQNLSGELATEAMQLANNIAAKANNPDLSVAVDTANQAIEIARQALAQDVSIAIAHTAIGLASRQTWQWEQAQTAFEQAYALDPDNPVITFNYGWFSAFIGNADRSIAIGQRAINLHPDSANAQRDLGIIYAYAGLPLAASDSLQRCIDRDPSIGVCHIYRGFMESRIGNSAEAEKELREAERLFGESVSPAAASSLAHAYFKLGLSKDTRRMFNILLRMDSERVVGSGTWPLAFLAIGDNDAAYDWLQRSMQKMASHEPDEGFFNLMIIKANIQDNPVLEEPRFRELRDQIGTH